MQTTALSMLRMVVGMVALFLLGVDMPSAATVSYRYDRLNRLIQVTYADGAVIVYEYDAAGNRIKKLASPDTDGDGVLNLTDPDDDNDGTPDGDDAFSLDAAESRDSDGDGIGDNADTDDDNDGYADGIDPYPFDPSRIPPARVAIWQPTLTLFRLDSDASGTWSAGDTTITGFGDSMAVPVAGDWNGDGFDEVGVWVGSTGRFHLDANGNHVWDGLVGGDLQTAPFGLGTDLPVVGDWDADGRDEVGYWRPSDRRFRLDSNGNGRWDGVTGGDAVTAAFGLETDVPITGDWNGDGRDEVGLWRPGTGRFLLDTNANQVWDGPTGGDVLTSAFGGRSDIPVIGDWNGNGVDDIGVWRPGTQRFLLDANANRRWDGATGGDTLSAPFGLGTDRPLSGRW